MRQTSVHIFQNKSICKAKCFDCSATQVVISVSQRLELLRAGKFSMSSFSSIRIAFSAIELSSNSLNVGRGKETRDAFWKTASLLKSQSRRSSSLLPNGTPDTRLCPCIVHVNLRLIHPVSRQPLPSWSIRNSNLIVVRKVLYLKQQRAASGQKNLLGPYCFALEKVFYTQSNKF